LFHRDKQDLAEAKSILEKYKHIPYAQELLKMIDEINKE
jgi:hypothetical protein